MALLSVTILVLRLGVLGGSNGLALRAGNRREIRRDRKRTAQVYNSHMSFIHSL